MRWRPIEIRRAGKKNLHRRHLSGKERMVRRGKPVRIPGIDFRRATQESLEQIQIAPLRSPHQRRKAFRVARIDIGAARQQTFRQDRVALSNRLEQCRVVAANCDFRDHGPDGG